MSICDLHVHSYFSDGSLSPAQLVSLARQAGVRALALCDHNTVSGLEEFACAAEQAGDLTAVLGIEFSVDYREQEVHLLALFLQREDFPAVNAHLQKAVEEKEASNLLLIENLKKAGIELDYAQIKEQSPSGQVNRAVIGSYMVKHGFCANIEEAFSRFLDLKNGYFIPPRRPDVFETLDLIARLGAVSVLAHPFLNLDEDRLLEFLPTAKEHGLCALEVYYPKFSPEQVEYLQTLCRKFSLLESGGSDFHGDSKPDIMLGTGRGNLAMPMEIYHNLRARAAR